MFSKLKRNTKLLYVNMTKVRTGHDEVKTRRVELRAEQDFLT